MKKYYLSAIAIIFSSVLSAQQSNSLTNQAGLPNTFTYNKGNAGYTYNGLKYSEVQGSPYYNQDYIEAKIGEFPGTYFVKYNSYTDEIEFKKGEEVLSIPKTADYTIVKLLKTNENIIYVNNNANSGYYFDLTKGGKYAALKRIRTKFIEEKPAESSYASAIPAKFQTGNATYHVLCEGKVISFKGTKDLVAALPYKPSGIADFIKSNKIKADNEKDLIKLVDYLNAN